MPETIELSGTALPTSSDTPHETVTFPPRSRRRGAVIELEDIRIQQGGAYIEDAFYDKLTYHKCHRDFLKVYRLHIGWKCQAAISFVIFLLHILILFENPSSLSETTDIRSPKNSRLEVPFPVTLVVEGLCLAVLCVDCSLKVYGYGVGNMRSYRWLVVYALCLSLSFSGWMIALCLKGLPCLVWCKLRCILRPFFLLQHSSVVKKAFMCLAKAIPSIFSVFLLFFIHVVLFTLIGLIVFPANKGPVSMSHYDSSYSLHFGHIFVEGLTNMFMLLTTAYNPDIMTKAYNSNRAYAIFFIVYVAIGVHFLLHILFAVVFQKFREYFRDSMRQTVLKRKAALLAAFEVLSDYDGSLTRFLPFDRLYSVISTLSLRSKVTEAFSKRVRELEKSNTIVTWDIFFKEIYSCMFPKRNRRQRFAYFYMHNFDPLNGHRQAVANAKTDIKQLDNALDREQRKTKYLKAYLRLIFAHPWFIHFGSFATIVNVVAILAQVSDPKNPEHFFVETETIFFICYYLFEQIILIWVLGHSYYFSRSLHKLDFMSLVSSFLSSIFFTIVYQGLQLSPDVQESALLVLGGAAHICIGIRLLRIILSMKLPNLIFKTMVDLVYNNLAPFIGLLFCFYYVFAILGTMIFANTIEWKFSMEYCWRFEGIDVFLPNMSEYTTRCEYGAGFHQRDYWAQNFDDFASAIVVLWNLMLVNNMDIFVEAFTKATNSWAILYFITWYILSVAMVMSLLTAVIVENFLMRWEIFAKNESRRKLQRLEIRVELERQEAQTFAESELQTATDGQEALTRWQKGRVLSRKRAKVAEQGANSARETARAASVGLTSQSEQFNLVQVLNVKMPSLEEIRQHLALSPYSPTAFALNVQGFNATYGTNV